MKDIYDTPELTEIGSFEELTQASSTESRWLDANFGIGTPTGQLTFS